MHRTSFGGVRASGTDLGHLRTESAESFQVTSRRVRCSRPRSILITFAPLGGCREMPPAIASERVYGGPTRSDLLQVMARERREKRARSLRPVTLAPAPHS